MGNAVSNYVDPLGWLNRSIDNPWEVFPSPDTAGVYTDVAVIGANGDEFLDLVATTEGSGVKCFLRNGIFAWDAGSSPITTGDWYSVTEGDFNEDSLADFVVGGNSGVRLFAGDGNGNWSETPSPLLAYTVYDVDLVYLDDDFHLDLVAALGGDPGNGVRVFYGDGAGSWIVGSVPTTQNIYRQIAVADFNNDGHRDIAASNSEFLGVKVWLGDSLGAWTSGTTAGVNHAFYGLAVGDVNHDGYSDIVAGGNVYNEGVQVFWNNQNGGWNAGYTPASQGIFNDIGLVDMNGDGALDIAASGHGSGVSAWVGTSSSTWSYWYHPTSSGIYRGLDVKDITLNNTRDLITTSFGNGIRIWDNRTPIVYDMPVTTNPGNIDFGPVLVNYSSTEPLRLTNVSNDTVRNIVIYTTNPRFQVGVARDIGPFDLPPQSFLDVEVTFSPLTPGVENEAVGIYSSVAVLYVPLHGQGVSAGVTDWLAAISVRNNQGGPGNSDSLYFGAGIGATDGLDVPYAEMELPPIPPDELFDARWTIPGLEGFDRDIRDRNQTEHTYHVQWQAGSAGYPVTISWSPARLPPGSFLIHDGMGGIIIDTVSMKTVSSIVVSNPGLTTLQIDYSALSSFNYGFGSGWSLSSIPVNPEFNEVDSLFPTALSAFWYNPSTPGYGLMNALDPGYGYWIEFPSPTNRTIFGMPVIQQTVTLQAGWNLVGANWDTVAVNALTVDPPGSLISVWSFSGQYNQASSVQSGRGYWMNVSQNCQITWPAAVAGSNFDENPGVPGKGMTVQARERSITEEVVPDRAWTTWLDLSYGIEESTETIRLLFGNHPDATNGLDLAIGERELPPVPPVPIHDARFLINESNGTNTDLRPANGQQVEYHVVWQASSADYPIRLTWDSSDLAGQGTFVLTDVTGGQVLPAVDLTEQSGLVIPDSTSVITEMIIHATFTQTGTGPQVDPGIPVSYDLKPCYPNPFNATTIIRFDLPRDSHLRLAIYNVLGQRAVVMAEGQWAAGSHFVVWDGRDNNGSDLGSGVYLCTMESDTYRETIKLVVAK